MKATFKVLGLLALTGALVVLTGCIMEDKVVELVFSGETCAEFVENHATGDFSSESTGRGSRRYRISRISGVCFLPIPDTLLPGHRQLLFLRSSMG